MLLNTVVFQISESSKAFFLKNHFVLYTYFIEFIKHKQQ